MGVTLASTFVAGRGIAANHAKWPDIEREREKRRSAEALRIEALVELKLGKPNGEGNRQSADIGLRN